MGRYRHGVRRRASVVRPASLPVALGTIATAILMPTSQPMAACAPAAGAGTPAPGTTVTCSGATANQNGTALYEGVTVLFLAQLAGVDLSFGQQLMVVYLAILGGIGTAGVPAGSIPFIVGVLASINQTLADAGATLTVKNKKGLSPLDLAQGKSAGEDDEEAKAPVPHPSTAELLGRLMGLSTEANAGSDTTSGSQTGSKQ